MLRPLFTAPGRADFSVALPLVLGASLLAAAPPIHARLTFADYQVLPSDRTVDLLIWMAPDDPTRPAFTGSEPSPSPTPGEGFSEPAGDSLSPSTDTLSLPPAAAGPACAHGGEAWRIVSCRVSEPRPEAGPLERHLHWAFLNLGTATRRIDLTAREEHRPTLDSLPRPVIAFWRRRDSCDYLVLHKDSYAPAAAGRLACPDLATALSGLEIDLADRMNRPNRLHVSLQEKLVSSPSTPFRDRLEDLEAGADAMVALAIMTSADTEDEQGPITISRQVFDLEDMASHAVPPFGGKLFLLYGHQAGFRIGYEYARLALDARVMSSLRSEFMAANSRRLDDWRIRRHTFSCELMLGRTYQGKDGTAYLGGLLGLARINYSETATVDGKDEQVGGFLKDVTGFLLGAQARIHVRDLVGFGVEAGFCAKEFALKTTGEQPDGSASEFQLRLTLGIQKTFHLGSRVK